MSYDEHDEVFYKLSNYSYDEDVEEFGSEYFDEDEE